MLQMPRTVRDVPRDARAENIFQMDRRDLDKVHTLMRREREKYAGSKLTV